MLTSEKKLKIRENLIKSEQTTLTNRIKIFGMISLPGSHPTVKDNNGLDMHKMRYNN